MEKPSNGDHQVFDAECNSNKCRTKVAQQKKEEEGGKELVLVPLVLSHPGREESSLLIREKEEKVGKEARKAFKKQEKQKKCRNVQDPSRRKQDPETKVNIYFKISVVVFSTNEQHLSRLVCL